SEFPDLLGPVIRMPGQGGTAGLDFKTPQATAERLLRQALELEPQHYWAHLLFGQNHLVGKQPHAAEMAFSKCIALRPRDGVVYAERGQARFHLRKQTTAPDLRKELERRGLEDLKQALKCDPNEPDFHRIHAILRADLGQRHETLQAYTRGVEVDAPL